MTATNESYQRYPTKKEIMDRLIFIELRTKELISKLLIAGLEGEAENIKLAIDLMKNSKERISQQ